MMISTAKQGMAQNNFREAGYWLDKTVDQLLSEAIVRTPDKISIIADRVDREQALRLTYRELGNLVDRAASSLNRLGVGPRDVVTVQLPNWWEFVVTALACSKIGAVFNPVMPILRERELLYVLNFCESKVFIVPKIYRGFDYAAMTEGMRGELRHLKHLIVVDGDGDSSFERSILSAEPGGQSAKSPGLPPAVGPADMAAACVTSGPNGQSKGAVYSSTPRI